MNSVKTHETVVKMTRMAVLIAIIAVLTLFNIGNIPIGPIVATIYHIPVIIGAVMLGPVAGGVLGGFWGVLCFVLAVTGNTTDVVALAAVQQSPLVYFLIAFVPRLLTGLAAGLVFKACEKLLKKKFTSVSAGVAGAIGSLTNTVFYLGGLYVLVADILARVYSMDIGAVGAMVMGVALSNGLVEAAVSALLTAAVSGALMVVTRKKK